MNKIIDWRLILALFITALLLLSQILFRSESMGGAECRRSLTDSSPGNIQTTSYGAYYGFPATFLSTFTEGCFENRVSHIDNLFAVGLVADILFIGILGTAPYWLLPIWHRVRH